MAPFKAALVHDGIPFTSFAVDDVAAEYERLLAAVRAGLTAGYDDSALGKRVSKSRILTTSGRTAIRHIRMSAGS